MTITLSVQEVLRDPTPFVKGFRLAVNGILLLSDDDFRIFEAEEAGPDDDHSLRIDDPIAAAKVREALSQPSPGGWWYLGRAIVEAWTRPDGSGWVLQGVVSVWLYEMNGEQPVQITVRQHPWGWDQIK